MTYYEQMHIAALERIATALEYIVERENEIREEQKKFEAEQKNYVPPFYVSSDMYETMRKVVDAEEEESE